MIASLKKHRRKNVSVSRWEANRYVRQRENLKDGESSVGKTVVEVNDKKLVEAFVKMKTDREQKQEQLERKQEQDAQKRALDQI